MRSSGLVLMYTDRISEGGGVTNLLFQGDLKFKMADLFEKCGSVSHILGRTASVGKAVILSHCVLVVLRSPSIAQPADPLTVQSVVYRAIPSKQCLDVQRPDV